VCFVCVHDLATRRMGKATGDGKIVRRECGEFDCYFIRTSGQSKVVRFAFIRIIDCLQQCLQDRVGPAMLSYYVIITLRTVAAAFPSGRL
jgi:hypothetical protein